MDDLPAAWQLKKLGDVCLINPSKAEIRGYADGLEVTFVPMAGVSETVGEIGRPETRKLGLVRKGYTYFREGDVLFAKITPCMENGKAAVARGLVNGLGFGSTEFHVFRPLADVLPEWVFYWVRRPSFRDQAAASFTGSVGQQRVPEWFLTEHEIPLPPLEDQRRIVGRIEALAQRIEEAKGLRRAARQEAEVLLPAALREAFARDPIGQVCRLGDILLETRYGTSRKCTASPAGTPVLRIPNVVAGRIELSDLKYAEIREPEVTSLSLESGDLLMVRTNGSRTLIGRTACVGQAQRGYAFASYLIRLRVDKARISGQYLEAFLESPRGRSQIEALAQTAAGQYNLSGTKVRSIEIPLLPLGEQRRIVAYLDSVQTRAQALLRLQEETQRELDALLPSVLDRAFRGEL